MRLLPVMRQALHALRGAGKAFIVAAGSGGFHMTDDVQDMIQRLRLAHRIHNPVATLRMCDEAADMISDLAGRLEAAEAKSGQRRPPRTSGEAPR
jgi:sirohydrochlorin ferrochelatase